MPASVLRVPPAINAELASLGRHAFTLQAIAPGAPAPLLRDQVVATIEAGRRLALRLHAALSSRFPRSTVSVQLLGSGGERLFVVES